MSYAILLGGIVLVVFCLVLNCLGLALSLAVLPSLPLSVCVSWFFLRRKRLLRQLLEQDVERDREVEAVSRRLEHLYSASPLAILTLQVSSRTVQRTSRGFASMLGMDSGTNLAGTPLASLLKVQPAQMDALEAHLGDSSSGEPITLSCLDSEGQSIDLRVSGWMLDESGLAEVVFAPDTGLRFQDRDFEEGIEELEAFRKMMMRRENRILQLKSEVNRLLVDSRSAPRYSIDSETVDNRIHELTRRKTET